MNKHICNELSPDKKIGDVFYAFGYSIPVSKKGKILWPIIFKRAMVLKLIGNELTANQISVGCKVPIAKVYEWKRCHLHHVETQIEEDLSQEPVFAEIKIQEDGNETIRIQHELKLKAKELELVFPVDYTVDAVIRIFQALQMQQ